MVGLVSDSSEVDEVTGLEVSIPAAEISELDLSSPLFDSLPDFSSLKDYWICGSPVEEIFCSGIEEVMDLVGSEDGTEMRIEAEKDILVGRSDVSPNGRGSVVGNEEMEKLEGSERLILAGGGDGVEGEAKTVMVMSVESEGLEADEGRGEVDENGALEEVKISEKMEFEISESLRPSIEADMRRVSLDGPDDVAVARDRMDEKIEVKCKEAESDSSSESESESESSSSEATSSESSSSSDDDDEEEDVVVGRNAELAALMEEGEILDEDVEQMVAWSDDEDVAPKGPIRSKNEMTDLPPVPPIDVTLNPNHQTLPVGVVLSIVGKQIIVEGVEKHMPLNEGSILWITENRLPLGLVDDIFGPVKNPYYSIRYNSEDEVPSGISVGTHVSFVQEFVNHVINDGSLYKKGYDASNENDEELSEEAEFSDDEKEAEYRRMLKTSKRDSNEDAGGKRKKDKRKNRNQERNWNNPLPSPQTNSNEGNVASHNIQYSPASETPRDQRNQFSEGGHPSPLSTGTAAPFQNIRHPSFNLGSNGAWPNGMPIQQQQPMFFPNAFPTNGIPWMQQNSLIRNPYMSMPIPPGLPFPQQFGHNQMLPPNLLFPGGQQFLMGGSSNPPFPGFFSQNNFNLGNGQPMATSAPAASQTSSTQQNGAVQHPSNIPGSPDNNTQQVLSDIPSGRGRNPNSQWRGRSGSRGGRFGRGRGFNCRGRGRQQGH